MSYPKWFVPSEVFPALGGAAQMGKTWTAHFALKYTSDFNGTVGEVLSVTDNQPSGINCNGTRLTVTWYLNETIVAICSKRGRARERITGRYSEDLGKRPDLG